MKILPLFATVAVLGIPSIAQARDRVSIGIGVSAGPVWGSGYSRPYYYGRHCAPYSVYAPPVYFAPPAPVYYYAPPVYPSAPLYQGVPVYGGQYQPAPTPLESRVVRVQAALRQRKYYHGAIDGLSGPETQSAIRAYQIDRGMPVTGRIDSELLADLGL